MKIIWEEIYSDQDDGVHEDIHNGLQATFRAQVIGGWLIRHELLLDAKREDINHEGWTQVHNSMLFLPDPGHKWDQWDDPMLGVCHE